MKVVYKDSQILIFRKAVGTVLINTDKPIYKAGDQVVVKVFGTDSETRPCNIENAVVTIYNPDEVKLKVFSNFTFSVGKFQDSINLGENPSLGTYKISFVADTIVSLETRYTI